MRFEVLVTIVLVSEILYGEGLECDYCRGNACNEKEVPKINCGEQINTLPYNFDSDYSNFENQIHACLDLEYSKGQRKTPIRQCVLLSELHNVCDKITFSLPSSVTLDKCDIVRHKRAADDQTTTTDQSTSISSSTPLSSVTTTLVTSSTPISSITTTIATTPAVTTIIPSTDMSKLSTASTTISTSKPLETTISSTTPATTAMTSPTPTLSNEIPKAPSTSLPQTTTKLPTKVSAPEETKISHTEGPKTALLTANQSTVSVNLSTSVNAHTTPKPIVTTHTITTTPKGSSSVLCISFITLFLSVSTQIW